MINKTTLIESGWHNLIEIAKVTKYIINKIFFVESRHTFTGRYVNECTRSF